MPGRFSLGTETEPTARYVTLWATISLDGCLAPCGAGLSSGGFDITRSPGFAGFLASVDTVVMGRKTYDLWRAERPWRDEQRRCVVLSRMRAGQREGEAEFVEGDVADIVAELRTNSKRGVWLAGGSEVVAPCLAGGVVDRVIISVAPLLLGEGTPLFSPIARATSLRLREGRAHADGTMQLQYDVVH